MDFIDLKKILPIATCSWAWVQKMSTLISTKHQRTETKQKETWTLATWYLHTHSHTPRASLLCKIHLYILQDLPLGSGSAYDTWWGEGDGTGMAQGHPRSLHGALLLRPPHWKVLLLVIFFPFKLQLKYILTRDWGRAWNAVRHFLRERFCIFV